MKLDLKLVLPALYKVAQLHPELTKYLRDPRFLKAIKQPFTVNRDYDIPLVAGNSTDFETMYIDKHLGLTDKGHDVEPFLAIHERTEWPLMHILGLPYDIKGKISAHPIAEMIEEAAVRLQGIIPIKEYNHHYTKSIKDDAKEVTDLPPDLDPKPYSGSKMPEIVKKLSA